jgi:hypothetical protein
MKIAVQFAGQLRSFVQPLQFFKRNVLQYLDCDIFLSTWKSMPAQMYEDQGPIEQFNDICKITALRTDKLTPNFQRNLIDACYNGWLIWEKNVKVEYMVYGFYHKYMCNRLREDYEMQNGIKYDAIIMLRPDLVLAEPFPVDILEHADDYLMIPAGSDWEWGINDLMAVGGSKHAEAYCDLYNNLEDYANRGVMIHPEHLNRYNIEELNIPLRRFSYITHLRARRMT